MNRFRSLFVLCSDAVDSPEGAGFRIDNPNAQVGEIRQIPVAELKRRIDASQAGELFDLRTPEEHAKASIGTRLMTHEETERIAALPRDTPLIFHCHSGGRSQAAAEHFAALGFTEVYNVVGGIDAWSTEIDPSVPRANCSARPPLAPQRTCIRVCSDEKRFAFHWISPRSAESSRPISNAQPYRSRSSFDGRLRK